MRSLRCVFSEKSLQDAGLGDATENDIERGEEIRDEIETTGGVT